MGSDEELFHKMMTMIKRLADTQKSLEEKIEELYSNDYAIDVGMDNLKYEIGYEIINKNIQFPQLESIDDTIEKIIQGSSMCRFGDGEFSIMSGIKQTEVSDLIKKVTGSFDKGIQYK